MWYAYIKNKGIPRKTRLKKMKRNVKMIRIEKEYVLRQIGDDYIIVPVGKSVLSFNGMITVNETGAFLWEQLVEGTNKEELLRTMLETYEVTQEEAERDIDEFLDVLYKNNIL